MTDNRERPFFAPYQHVPLNGCEPSREYIGTNTEFHHHPSPEVTVDSGYYNQTKTYSCSSITTTDLQLQQEETTNQAYHRQQQNMDQHQHQHRFEPQQQPGYGPQHIQGQWCCQEQNHQQRKTVSFSESVDVLEVKHLNDIDDEEREQTWFSKDDYARIKAEIYYHLQRKGSRANPPRRENNTEVLVDTSNFTFRGLETKSLQQQRRHNQREARDAVLNEQLFQRTEKSHLPEVIAMLYNVLSFPCQQHAFEVGVQDAKTVYSNSSNGDDDMMEDTGHEVRLSQATPQMLFECMPMDSEIVYAGDSIVERLAQEEASYSNSIRSEAGSPLATVESVEDWLVERFQIGKLLARQLVPIRQLNTNAVPETRCSGRYSHIE